MQPEDTIKMFGFEYKLITTVVIVRNINHSSTKITYSIEDFSGLFVMSLDLSAKSLKQIILQEELKLIFGLKKVKLQLYQI